MKAKKIKIQNLYMMMAQNMNYLVSISKQLAHRKTVTFSPEVKWFHERLLLLLKEIFVLDIRHVAATLLHPYCSSDWILSKLLRTFGTFT